MKTSKVISRFWLFNTCSSCFNVTRWFMLRSLMDNEKKHTKNEIKNKHFGRCCIHKVNIREWIRIKVPILLVMKYLLALMKEQTTHQDFRVLKKRWLEWKLNHLRISQWKEWIVKMKDSHKEKEPRDWYCCQKLLLGYLWLYLISGFCETIMMNEEIKKGERNKSFWDFWYLRKG